MKNVKFISTTKLLLPSYQLPVKGNGILGTTLTCYDIVVSKVLVEFLNKRLSYSGNVLIERIPQRIYHLGYCEVESVGRNCL